MQTEIEIVTDDGRSVEDALVLVGVPTMGIVGTITAQYLIDQLDAPAIGGVYSDRFPPVGRVIGGRSGFPVRLHALDTRCGLNLDCNRLVIAVTEFLPGGQTLYALAEGLTGWAAEHGASMIVIPDGLVVRGEEGPTVYGVASLETGLETLDQAGVEVMDDGILMGVSAAMIANGRRKGVDTVSMLAETAFDRPDARAASRLVEVLDQFVPDIDIETAPLLKEAEQIEEQTRRLREQLETHAEAAEPGYYPSMYQ